MGVDVSADALMGVDVSADVDLGASLDASAEVGGSGASVIAPADVGGLGASVYASARSDEDAPEDVRGPRTPSSDEDAPEDVRADALLSHVVTPLEGKMAQAHLLQINPADKPLYAELLNDLASKSGFKRGTISSSSSDLMPQAKKKLLKAHVTISSDDETPTNSETRCDYPCLPCAMAGVPPILGCCLQHGHSEVHLCILCKTSSVSTNNMLPVVVDITQAESQS